MHQHLIDSYPQNQIIREDDHEYRIASYFEVQSKSFSFTDYDFGSKELKEKYGVGRKLYRYFNKRKFLFSKFQQGIQIDEESWYSVIPQAVSLYLKERLKRNKINKIFQPFCGVGGIAIHLSDSFKEYIVNDIDKNKIKMLKHNMKLYNKNINTLKYYTQNFLQVEPFKTDAIIICPPWGGIQTDRYATQDLDSLMNPQLSSILSHALNFTTQIILQMPKQTNINNLIKVMHKVGIKPIFTIEKIQTNDICSQLFIYFGSHAFTDISTPSLTLAIVNDCQNQNKTSKKKIKTLQKENREGLMKELYRVRYPNKHIFFS